MMQFNEYKFVDYEAENSIGMSLQINTISHLCFTKWTSSSDMFQI